VCHQNRVALVESAALCILAREADGIAFQNQRTVSEQFGEPVINGAFAVAHFGTLLQKLHDFRVNVEPGRRAHKAIGDFRQVSGERPVSTSYFGSYLPKLKGVQ